MPGIATHLLQDFAAPAAGADNECAFHQSTAPPSMTKLVPVTQRLASASR